MKIAFAGFLPSASPSWCAATCPFPAKPSRATRRRSCSTRPIPTCWCRWASRRRWPRPRLACVWCRCRARASTASTAAPSVPGLRLANAYGHEAGIAEYIMGTMLSLTRSVRQPRCQPAQGPLGQPVGGRHAHAAAVARACRQDAGHPGLRPYRRGAGPPRRGLRHEGLRRSPAGAGRMPARRVVHRRS